MNSMNSKNFIKMQMLKFVYAILIKNRIMQIYSAKRFTTERNFMNLLSALGSAHFFNHKVRLLPLTTPWGEALDPDHVLEEYPRPQMIRDNFLSLNGYWDYTIISSKKHKTVSSGRILVPFSPEAPLSGVGKQLQPEDTLICERDLPERILPPYGKRCILHFGAVDQHACILINGHTVTEHTGGYLPFSVDITDLLTERSNLLTVCIEDKSDRSYHSCGKQKLKRGGMFYTAQSGIWQTVWIEWVPDIYITEMHLTPHYDKETVHVSLKMNRPVPACRDEDAVICHVLDADGNIISKGTCTNFSDSLCNYSCYCDVDRMQSWTPDHPYLYQLHVRAGKDEVTGYFAMRTYTIEKDKNGYSRFCLNHNPLFLNGVLDQGYWPDGLYTAPSDEAMIYDILKMKELGFNMLRKHVKIEPARWYYHCDRLGMIVWQDMVNGGAYHAPWMTWLPALFPKFKVALSDRMYLLLGRKNIHSREEFIHECRDTVEALKCFPCISTWVIFNEGWGQFDSKKLTRMFRELDPERLIDSASGWFDRGQGDFKSEHNYFDKQFVKPERRAFVISEYGGYACQIKGHVSTRSVYGYRVYQNAKDFNTAFHRLMAEEIEPLKKKGLCGAVYTQVSDIEEEVNGILTYDRKVCKVE